MEVFVAACVSLLSILAFLLVLCARARHVIFHRILIDFKFTVLLFVRFPRIVTQKRDSIKINIKNILSGIYGHVLYVRFTHIHPSFSYFFFCWSRVLSSHFFPVSFSLPRRNSGPGPLSRIFSPSPLRAGQMCVPSFLSRGYFSPLFPCRLASIGVCHDTYVCTINRYGHRIKNNRLTAVFGNPAGVYNYSFFPVTHKQPIYCFITFFLMFLHAAETWIMSNKSLVIKVTNRTKYRTPWEYARFKLRKNRKKKLWYPVFWRLYLMRAKQKPSAV